MRKPYEQIADQLREHMVNGDLRVGDRLPPEIELAAQFGVSRATVREALRVLAAEGLVSTVKGVTGGSFVAHPSVDDIGSYLRTHIGILSKSPEITLEQFLEAREYLEIPAVRLVAMRHNAEQLQEIRETIPENPRASGSEDQAFARNRRFHSTVLHVCGNPLLELAVQPIFYVLQTHLADSHLGWKFQDGIRAQHQRIAEAIMKRAPDLAEREMREHLQWLRPHYRRTWTAAVEQSRLDQ